MGGRLRPLSWPIGGGAGPKVQFQGKSKFKSFLVKTLRVRGDCRGIAAQY